MKKLKVLLVFIIILISGCSTEKNDLTKFNDKGIQLQLVGEYQNEYFVGYAIKLTNNTELTISYIDLYVSFPVGTKGGTSENSFVMVGIPQKEVPHLESGDSLEFTFEGFLELLTVEKLNLKKPIIKLTGYVDKDVSFEITGDLKSVVKK